ncbi:hypothetical protein [Synechococcus sp. BIOS-E4-1]|uniref:hypothetical protein n=1 Tax=Synechococcus sp. BIOS-E4-1 TaxID=1400864 RepID=UPI00164765E6|nr:hypothetical protein [Synechococcus sp. BIOS-E4-1]
MARIAPGMQEIQGFQSDRGAVAAKVWRQLPLCSRTLRISSRRDASAEASA